MKKTLTVKPIKSSTRVKPIKKSAPKTLSPRERKRRRNDHNSRKRSFYKSESIEHGIDLRPPFTETPS